MPLRVLVGCVPDGVASFTCLVFVPDLAPEFGHRPSGLMTLFRVLSAYWGIGVSFVQLFSPPDSLGRGIWSKGVF